MASARARRRDGAGGAEALAWTAVRDGQKVTLGGFAPNEDGRPAWRARSVRRFPGVVVTDEIGSRAARPRRSRPRSLCSGPARAGCRTARLSSWIRRSPCQATRPLHDAFAPPRRRAPRGVSGQLQVGPPGREAVPLAGREAGRTITLSATLLRRSEGRARRAGRQGGRRPPRRRSDGAVAGAPTGFEPWPPPAP